MESKDSVQKPASPGSAAFHGGAASLERHVEMRRAAVEGGATGPFQTCFPSKGHQPHRSKICDPTAVGPAMEATGRKDADRGNVLGYGSIRLEKHAGGKRTSEKRAAAWTKASIELPIDPNGIGDRETVSEILDRLDSILEDAGVSEFSRLSRTSKTGFESDKNESSNAAFERFGSRPEFCQALREEIHMEHGLDARPVFFETSEPIDPSPEYAYENDAPTSKPSGIKYRLWMDLGKPVAVLSAFKQDQSPRKLGGSWEGKVKISDDFDEVDKDIADTFYGSSIFPDQA